MSSATLGHGAKIGYSTVAGGPYTDIDEVLSIDPGSEKADQLEVSHLRSANRRKEKIDGMIDSGECTVKMNTLFDANRTALRGYINTGTLLYWSVRFYDTSTTPETLEATDTFSGPVSSFKDDPIEPNKPKTSTMVITISSDITEV